MVELFRNQNAISRQPLVQPQQFNMQPSGRPSNFRDQQQAPSQVANLPNMSMQNQSLPYRNEMLPQLLANPQMRHDMMGLAQNSIPSNGQMNMTQRMMQQPHQQGGPNAHPGQPAVFSPADPVSTGPHPVLGHGNMVNAHAPQSLQPSQSVPSRNPSRSEMLDRLHQAETAISNLEQNLNQVKENGNVSETERQQKISQYAIELKGRKEHAARLRNVLFRQHTQSNMNLLGGVPAQHQPSGGVQGIPQRINQASPSQMIPGMNGAQIGQGVPSQSQSQAMPAAPSQIQPPSNHAMNQSPVPPRSGPTPHQLLGNQGSPGMLSSSPFPMGGARPTMPNPQQQLFIPPLAKDKFDSGFATWCTTKGINIDPRLLSIDGRHVDLYLLHFHVLRNGNAMIVTQKDLWPVIGGHMGFVQFPGHDSEPARSSPAVAGQLAHIYKEYVADFDVAYLRTVIQEKSKSQGQQPPAFTAAYNQLAMTRPGITPQQMQDLTKYAHLPVPDLRARGVPEKLITFVETHRATLQRSLQTQEMFRGMMAPKNPISGSGQLAEQASAPSTQFPAPQQQPMLPSSVPRPPPTQVPTQRGTMPGNDRPGLPAPTLSNGGPQAPVRITRAQAEAMIKKLKEEFHPPFQPTPIPENQVAEFMALAEQAYTCAVELEPRLPMWLMVIRSEEALKRLITMVCTAHRQRAILQEPPPRCLINPRELMSITAHMQTAMATLDNAANLMMQRTLNQNNQMPSRPPAVASMPVVSRPQAAPVLPPAPPPAQHPPAPRQTLAPPPSPKKKAQTVSHANPSTSTNNASSPVPPPASASTPVASASTPTHVAASPRTPKSPNRKATAKPKTPKRRASKSTSQTIDAPKPPSPPPVSSTPIGEKRAREEDVPAVSATSGSDSSPKRPKTNEWEGPPSEALAKKRQEIEDIKTDEDACAFYNSMADLIQRVGESEDSLTSDISDALDLILKGCSTSVPDFPESASMASFGLGEAGIESSSHAVLDEFHQFFDLSSCVEQDDPPATTPELVSSSSTNTSPSSASEVDVTHQTPSAPDPVKIEPETQADLSNSLRLGTFREIDGGESAYYQPDNWKWDGSMPTLEQPWAIFTA